MTIRAVMAQYGVGLNLPMEFLTTEDGIKWYVSIVSSIDSLVYQVQHTAAAAA
jgi:hypothetical protein